MALRIMKADPTSRAALVLIATVAICAGLYFASSVFAPLAFALLIIAILQPVQKWLQAILPKLVALAITTVVLLVGFMVLGWLVAWTLGRVGQAIANDAARFQSIYDQLIAWLDGHGIAVSAIWSEYMNVGWFIRLFQSVVTRVNSTMSFWLVVLVYVTLGLLEVDDFERNASKIKSKEVSRVLLDGSRQTAKKLRSYYMVRTQMSVITGLLVYGVAYAVGLPLAREWGVLAFVLNYIPFLGPLIATMFPTVYAIAEFQSWEVPLFIFVSLNVVQIAIGSYLEPRVSGSVLSISPLLVLFSVFFWAYLWGIFGAFIGVPISIAILTYCDQSEATRWVADLFGGDRRGRDDCAELDSQSPAL
jgi:predicted PurR-regulated permease PerM